MKASMRHHSSGSLSEIWFRSFSWSAMSNSNKNVNMLQTRVAWFQDKMIPFLQFKMKRDKGLEI